MAAFLICFWQFLNEGPQQTAIKLQSRGILLVEELPCSQWSLACVFQLPPHQRCSCSGLALQSRDAHHVAVWVLSMRKKKLIKRSSCTYINIKVWTLTKALGREREMELEARKWKNKVARELKEIFRG